MCFHEIFGTLDHRLPFQIGINSLLISLRIVFTAVAPYKYVYYYYYYYSTYELLCCKSQISTSYGPETPQQILMQLGIYN